MAKKITVAYLNDEGQPATGLTPTIRIRELATNTLVVTDAAMTEVGDGAYSYEFTAYDPAVDYSFRSDAGATLVSRYGFNSTEEDDSAVINQMATDITFIRNAESGKWEIVDNQMIFYTPDGLTEIMRFNLFNEAGDPSMVSVYKRESV